MTNKDIFIKEAKKAKICSEGLQALISSDNAIELLDIFFEGSDWAIENNYPSIDLAKENKDFLHEIGFYVDYEGIITHDDTQLLRSVIYGNSTVDLELSGYSVTEILVRHKSKISVHASDNAFVVIYMADQASADIETTGSGQVRVSTYGNRNRIKCEGNVLVFNPKIEA